MQLITIINQIDIWTDWLNSYKKYVPQFIEEAKTKEKWQDWNKEVFHEYFERSRNQCVSSLQQGYFTKDERSNIREHWEQISPLLKKVVESQNEPLWDVYKQLQKEIRGLTNSNRKAATYRMIAGLQPNLLCTVINEDSIRQLHKMLRDKVDEDVPNFTGDWFRDSYNIFKVYKASKPGVNPQELATLPWQTKMYFEEGGLTIPNNNDMSEPITSHQNVIELLKYKKQIIIQGPPGTGKTRMAKELASILIDLKPEVNKTPITISDEDIKQVIQPDMSINSVSGGAAYQITKVLDDRVVSLKSNGTEDETLFKNIQEAYKNARWTSPIGDNPARRASAFAKYIYDHFPAPTDQVPLKTSPQFKLVQFHPSYSYEDFVRGIVAEPNEDEEIVLYKAKDKLLAKFAAAAAENYRLSQAVKAKSTQTIQVKSDFERFIEHVQDYIADSDSHKYQLTDGIYIFDSDSTRFKYKGDNWAAHAKGLNMKYSELEKIIQAGVSERSQVKSVEGLEELSRQHATYFFNTVRKFREFLSSHPAEIKEDVIEERTSLKNYVLIIDEINRANLSSVLGELIYALEYRGEEVDGLYDVGGSNKLVLPPNLYIIGTMNTADRSIGHIDYAIRRRFAFVEVKPQVLPEDFEKELFIEVSKLFVTDPFAEKLNPSQFLSSEFRPQDVWLGHSYFIRKKNVGPEVRLKYEIIPLLEEYVKDGVLKDSLTTWLEIERLQMYYSNE